MLKYKQMTSSLTINFIYWYFVTSPKAILKGWRNFLIWGADLFSLSLTAATFLSPWRKTVYPYRAKGLDFNALFDTIVVTNFSRLIGMVIRTLVLIFGLFFEIIIFLVGLVIFLAWFLLPIIIIFLLFNSIV
jgi:hypothetical protein